MISCRVAAAEGNIGEILNSNTAEYGSIGDIHNAGNAPEACVAAGEFGYVGEFNVGVIQSACNAFEACTSIAKRTTISEIKDCCNTDCVCKFATEDTLPDTCVLMLQQP